MVAYVISDVRKRDNAAFERYHSLATMTNAQYGGRYIVRGGESCGAESNLYAPVYPGPTSIRCGGSSPARASAVYSSPSAGRRSAAGSAWQFR
jgi:Domain of unknown function (DUF1330)